MNTPKLLFLQVTAHAVGGTWLASQVALGVAVPGKHFSRALGHLENGAIFPARFTEL